MERNNMDGFLGSRIRIRVPEGSYDGDIVKIDKDAEKISLKNVELTDNDNMKTKIPGLLHFFGSEIEEIKFYDEESVRARVDNMYLLMKPFVKPTHLNSLCIPSDEDIVQMGRGDKTKYFVPEIDTNGWPISVVISEMDLNFHQSIEKIKGEKIISVGAEGISISRFGTLCWISVCVNKVVFLFDICKLGADAFKNGLKEVLESYNIVKVMHNCRFLSDCLFHQYKVHLQEIFDSQVAMLIVAKRKNDVEQSAHFTSLQKCLQDVLSYDVNKFPMEDQSMWQKRPLSKHLRNVLVFQVMHLQLLRKVLLEKMLADFTSGVEQSLRSAKDEKDAIVYRLLKDPDVVSFHELDSRKSKTSFNYPDDARSFFAIDPSLGARESVDRLNYKFLRYSKEAWHAHLINRPKKAANEIQEDVDEEGFWDGCC